MKKCWSMFSDNTGNEWCFSCPTITDRNARICGAEREKSPLLIWAAYSGDMILSWTKVTPSVRSRVLTDWRTDPYMGVVRDGGTAPIINLLQCGRFTDGRRIFGGFGVCQTGYTSPPGVLSVPVYDLVKQDGITLWLTSLFNLRSNIYDWDPCVGRGTHVMERALPPRYSKGHIWLSYISWNCMQYTQYDVKPWLVILCGHQ